MCSRKPAPISRLSCGERARDIGVLAMMDRSHIFLLSIMVRAACCACKGNPAVNLGLRPVFLPPRFFALSRALFCSALLSLSQVLMLTCLVVAMVPSVELNELSSHSAGWEPQVAVSLGLACFFSDMGLCPWLRWQLLSGPTFSHWTFRIALELFHCFTSPSSQI